MLRIQQLVRRFGDLAALDEVTFQVRRGEIFGLLGHNGAGKTTLIRLITGLLHAHEGEITTLGLNPVAEGAQVRARTGVLTEYPALDHFLTPLENLEVYASINGMEPATARHRAAELITRLGLEDHVHLPSHSLSAGLKQRVALARALVHQPELLLLDEPTSNLDPLAARDVRDLVRELVRERGRTVLLSTHNLAEAQQLCDRVAILHHGRLLASGTLDELRASVTVGAVAITVTPSERPAAAHALRPLPDVEVMSEDCDTVEVRAASASVPAIVRALVDAGVDVHAVRPEAPTLEDVYVSLHVPRVPEASRDDVEVHS